MHYLISLLACCSHSQRNMEHIWKTTEGRPWAVYLMMLEKQNAQSEASFIARIAIFIWSMRPVDDGVVSFRIHDPSIEQNDWEQ